LRIGEADSADLLHPRSAFASRANRFIPKRGTKLFHLRLYATRG
jgi:hypothetical protein